MVERGRHVPLFRPERWTDQDDARSVLTPEQLAAHPLRRVFAGPYLPDGQGTIPRVLGPFPFAPGAALVIADADVLERLHAGRPTTREISAQALQDLDERSRHPVVMIHA